MRYPNVVRQVLTALAVVSLTCVLFSPTILAQTPEPVAEVASGHNGMVATAHPLASQAALEMLKAGGNAVDAAVAAAFAIGVVEPDGSGVGGGGGMVVYLRDRDQAFYINYYQRTSESIDKIKYDPESDRHTAKAVLVPGTVAGLTTALKEFGTLPLSQVMAPAIRYAERGFAIDATLAQLILDNTEMLLEDSVTSATFLDEGFPRMEGDTLRQPALAHTLKKIAAEGADGFYKGEVAKDLSSEITGRGGIMTMEDLADYRAELTTPVEGTYRGYRILSANAPQSGASIIEALNILENENLRALGHYSTSPATLHLMAETFKRVYADRWQYLGDPEFSYIPLNGLISKQFGWERYDDINRYRAEPREYRKTQAGNPARYDQARQVQAGRSQEKSSGKTYEWNDDEEDTKTSYEEWGEDLFDSWGGHKKSDKDKAKEKTAGKEKVKDTVVVPESGEEFDGHTTHLSIIDADGNMVALTQTLGTFFGAGIIVDGVLLNCGMSNFSKTAPVNMVKPGMQPRSSISPTVVLKNDKPFMVVGSPGASRIISTVTEIIVNVIDFNMDAAQANVAPRFYCQKFDDYLHLEGGISEDVGEQLDHMGHNIRWYQGRDLFFGGAQLIIVDPATGTYYGSADPRRGGVAIGY